MQCFSFSYQSTRWSQFSFSIQFSLFTFMFCKFVFLFDISWCIVHTFTLLPQPPNPPAKYFAYLFVYELKISFISVLLSYRFTYIFLFARFSRWNGKNVFSFSNVTTIRDMCSIHSITTMEHCVWSTWNVCVVKYLFDWDGFIEWRMEYECSHVAVL